ncbi:hypothetical protein ACWX0K_11410 [Nitrobacteraceae bacterium UC4446_H13]
MVSIAGIARFVRKLRAMPHSICINVAIKRLPYRQHRRERKEFVVWQIRVRRSIGIKHPAQAKSGGGLRQIELAQRSRIGDGGAAGERITGGGLNGAAQQKSGERQSNIAQDVSRRLHRAAPSMATPEGKSRAFPVLTTSEPALHDFAETDRPRLIARRSGPCR